MARHVSYLLGHGGSAQRLLRFPLPMPTHPLSMLSSKNSKLSAFAAVAECHLCSALTGQATAVFHDMAMERSMPLVSYTAADTLHHIRLWLY